ncbi:hypothetical protein IGI37_000776 [Enterococcus sp. AZ194]|uniref:DUF4422 domain-containing protein n=1 Tax=Enterococcus sp. AZ194 TaxID=2774629 RepID=UPI003F20C5CE
MPSIKIMVVTHKDSPMPKDSDLYVPTIVGRNKKKLNYKVFYRDDSGDNISEKNENYCELTAMYWAWKNLDADYIGVVHYRRFFMSRDNKNNIAPKEELLSLFNEVDVLLPKKRNYFIENMWSHYKHNHNIQDLIKTKGIIERKYPEFLASFEKVEKQKSSHRFNMFVMRKEMFHEYAEWLFDILFALEEEIDTSEYDPYQKRVFGFISERLLDVWVEQQKVNYREIPYKFTERQNWLKKGSKFVKNKIVNE